MPTLTRKRVNDRPETWHIHYAGVRVEVIVERSGARSTQATTRETIDTAPRLTSRERARRSCIGRP